MTQPMGYTGIPDLDREILSKLPDSELIKACSINKYFLNTVCSESFFRNRIFSKYPESESLKGNIGLENKNEATIKEWTRRAKKPETWKKFYFLMNYWVSKLKEDFGYNYTFGDPKTQYDLLKSSRLHPKYLLLNAARRGDFALVKYAVELGADVKEYDQLALFEAAGRGYLDIVNYLVSQGADILADGEKILQEAAGNRQLEMVRYLVERGVNPEVGLESAILGGNVDLIKYLVSKGVKIGSHELLTALFSNKLEVMKYLVEIGINNPEMDPELEAEFERDYRAGHIKPNVMEYYRKHIVNKL